MSTPFRTWSPPLVAEPDPFPEGSYLTDDLTGKRTFGDPYSIWARSTIIGDDRDEYMREVACRQEREASERAALLANVKAWSTFAAILITLLSALYGAWSFLGPRVCR